VIEQEGEGSVDGWVLDGVIIIQNQYKIVSKPDQVIDENGSDSLVRE
jgi:hypothetical protein